jgi:DNA-binding XRE family transcriptional regulator
MGRATVKKQKMSQGGTLEINGDNAFALAVLVLHDRVRRLPDDDRNDLYELIPHLLSDDVEEQRSAMKAATEILAQRPVRVLELDFLEGSNSELVQWTRFISKRIRKARKAAGLTQVELAERSGIPQSHISRLENGEHSPSAQTLKRLAQALNVPYEDLDPSAD